ncbi:MAG: YHS domain-containing protein [Deltaproteobacteria bacterium]|nr:YHS domain-containing protein [Deltaproteobacteria bacterium]
MIRSAIALVVLGLSIAACGGENNLPPATPATPGAGEHHAAPKAGGNVKAPGDAKVGDTTKCPVTGEEFTVEATSQKAEYEGKTYYFCCGGCKKKFESDPAKFVKKS